jgi:PAS domain S-box-containing protein
VARLRALPRAHKRTPLTARALFGDAVTLVDVQAVAKDSGWSALFWQAFTRSRNPMVLLDDQRRHVEVNGAYLALVGYRRGDLIGQPVYEFLAEGPLATTAEWEAALRQRQFTGVAEVVCADGRLVKVEFAGHPEVVTGRQLVLFVAIRTARAGRALPQAAPGPGDAAAAEAGLTGLSRRELDVVRLLALGLTGPEAAAELQLTHNTIRTHVRNAMNKSGSRSRAQLVAKALGNGVYGR